MKQVHQINNINQAKTLMNPTRVTILNLLDEPRTCKELSDELSISQQRVNNNIKELLKAKLIKKVKTRKKRNMMEGVYQAISLVYWFSPELSRDKKIKQLQDQESLHNLLVMSERLQKDASNLLGYSSTKEDVPSIGVTADVVLKTEKEREAFTRDFLKAMHDVLEKYQGVGKKNEEYTAMIVCYPTVSKEKEK